MVYCAGKSMEISRLLNYYIKAIDEVFMVYRLINHCDVGTLEEFVYHSPATRDLQILLDIPRGSSAYKQMETCGLLLK